MNQSKGMSQKLAPTFRSCIKAIDQKEADEDINSDMSEDDEYFEDPKIYQNKLKQVSKKGRASVSAEAYGAFNKKEAFVPRNINKTEAQKKKIKQRLSEVFMFAALESKETDLVISAMEEIKFKAGAWVIKQGEEGDYLYVVENGLLDCFKKFSANEEPKYLKTYQPGESFGELALLYNSPRQASIKAKTDCILFALDRATFNNIVKEAAIKRRERFEITLSKIELLNGMDPYERSKIADSVKVIKFKKDEFIIRQNESGESFYFIEEGTAIATKILQNQSKPEVVYEYKPGDYFGELALLKNNPRAANVIAQSDMVLLSLDRLSFIRLLGPLDDILKRNAQKYEKYV